MPRSVRPRPVPLSVALVCECCGRADMFASSAEAFQAGWDEPTHLPSWPVTCPVCPGTLIGDPAHTMLHGQPGWVADSAAYCAEKKARARAKLVKR